MTPTPEATRGQTMDNRNGPAQGIIVGLAVFLVITALVIAAATLVTARDVSVLACVPEDGLVTGTHVANRGYVEATVTADDTGEVLGTFKSRNTFGPDGRRDTGDEQSRTFTVQLSRATPATATWGNRAGEDEWGLARFPLCNPPTTTTPTTETTTWPTTPSTTETPPSTSTVVDTTTTVPEITPTEPTIVPSTTSSSTPPETSTSIDTSTSAPSTTAPTSSSPSTSDAPATTGPSASSSPTKPPPTSPPTTTTAANPGTGSPGELPRTGTGTDVLIAVGLALIGGGSALLFVRRWV